MGFLLNVFCDSGFHVSSENSLLKFTKEVPLTPSLSLRGEGKGEGVAISNRKREVRGICRKEGVVQA